MAHVSNSGTLMALASITNRSGATPEEERLLEHLISSSVVQRDRYPDVAHEPLYNVGVEDPEFRNFTGIAGDSIFHTFFRVAETHLTRRLSLLIAGVVGVGAGGLKFDRTSQWVASGLVPQADVPPVANDSGSAIGTAVNAQWHFTGDQTIFGDVYAVDDFDSSGPVKQDHYDIDDAGPEQVIDFLAQGLILCWVNDRDKIGPRALGNRSILAAPFADALRAVTQVHRSARIQTVSTASNGPMFDLLTGFKARTGYRGLCHSPLNFNGKGFINRIDALDRSAKRRELDSIVVGGRANLR